MFIEIDPDATVTEYKHETCSSCENPPIIGGIRFKYCSCRSMYYQRPATPEEYEENKRNRLTKRKQELEEELNSINVYLSRSL